MLNNPFLNGRFMAWWQGARRRPEVTDADPIEISQGCAHLPGQSGKTAAARAPERIDTLHSYLASMENFPEDITRCRGCLSRTRRILEIGCGAAEIAREIALGNPDICVLATDKYDWRAPCACGSAYRRVALAWREKRLVAQQSCPENFIVLRAEADMLRHLPDKSIDAVLMINPEPTVGAAVLNTLSSPSVYKKLRPGGYILILPYSREMGVMACGGMEFDHGPDWSRGLGFILSSALSFEPGPRRHWGVDLAASRYCLNSTQSDVYVHVVGKA